MTVIIESAIINPEIILIDFFEDLTAIHEQTNEAMEKIKPGNATTIPIPENI